jgi:tetratricopeptide (TPR) repeat protein
MKTLSLGGFALFMTLRLCAQQADSTEMFYQKAMAEKVAGRHKTAYEALQRAAVMSPARADVLRELGTEALELRKWEEAKAAFQQLEKISPDDQVALENLGTIFFSMRKWNDAITYGHRMLDKHIGTRVNYMLGKSYYELENYAKAFRYLDAAYQEDPANAQIPFMFARSFVDMSNYKQAVKYYREAIALDSTKANWIYELAMACSAIPDDKTAVTYYELALKKGVRADREFLENMANSYTLAGMPEKGIEQLTQLLEQRPGDIELLYNIADAYYHTGKYEKAIQYWEQVLVQDKENARSLYMIGLTYTRLGKKEKGMTLCNKAIEMDPSLSAYRDQVWKMVK